MLKFLKGGPFDNGTIQERLNQTDSWQNKINPTDIEIKEFKQLNT